LRSHNLQPDPIDLAKRLLQHDRDAVPQALNLSDDVRPEARERALALLDVLERELPFPGAARIGVTGAPGAGKSTLLDAFVRTLRRRGETVGIVAIDPSSPISGGALLGDRVRMRSGAADPGVFIRSMAARLRLGGLADPARAAVAILSAVFDRVFVETVGVGQSEAEVATLVDTLVFVVNPGTGDSLQFMKAGVVELPDLFVVNKADLGAAAERSVAEVESGLGIAERTDDGYRPPVLLVSARDGTGVEACVSVLDAQREALVSGGRLASLRREQREAFAIECLERRYGSYGVEKIGGSHALRERARERTAESTFGLVAELGREIEDALRKPA